MDVKELLEENTGEYLHDQVCKQRFLRRQKAHTHTHTHTHKPGIHQIKNMCFPKILLKKNEKSNYYLEEHF